MAHAAKEHTSKLIRNSEKGNDTFIENHFEEENHPLPEVDITRLSGDNEKLAIISKENETTEFDFQQNSFQPKNVLLSAEEH